MLCGLLFIILNPSSLLNLYLSTQKDVGLISFLHTSESERESEVLLLERKLFTITHHNCL